MQRPCDVCALISTCNGAIEKTCSCSIYSQRSAVEPDIHALDYPSRTMKVPRTETWRFCSGLILCCDIEYRGRESASHNHGANKRSHHKVYCGSCRAIQRIECIMVPNGGEPISIREQINVSTTPVYVSLPCQSFRPQTRHEARFHTVPFTVVSRPRAGKSALAALYHSAPVTSNWIKLFTKK